MKLLKRLKSEMIWIVFVVISFSSSMYLINEYTKYDYKTINSVSVKEAVESEEAQEDGTYESNDFLILKGLSALISKFLKS